MFNVATTEDSQANNEDWGWSAFSKDSAPTTSVEPRPSDPPPPQEPSSNSSENGVVRGWADDLGGLLVAAPSSNEDGGSGTSAAAPATSNGGGYDPFAELLGIGGFVPTPPSSSSAPPTETAPPSTGSPSLLPFDQLVPTLACRVVLRVLCAVCRTRECGVYVARV